MSLRGKLSKFWEAYKMLSTNFYDFFHGKTLQDRVYRALVKDQQVIIKEGKEYLLVESKDLEDIMKYIIELEQKLEK